MKKNKLYNLSLSVFIIIVIAATVVLWQDISSERKNCSSQSEIRMLSIARTLASQIDRDLIVNLKSVNPEKTKYGYQESMMELKYQLNRVQEINQLQKTAISILFYEAKERELKVLVSSESIYKFKEKYYDRSGEVIINYGVGGSKTIKINERLEKAVAFAPIHNLKNEVMGVIMIDQSINDDLALLESRIIRKTSAIIVFLTFLGIVFFKVAKRINKTFSNVLAGKADLKRKLNDKIQELELLKSISKKSDDLILISNTSGKILWVNQTSQAICGFSSEALVSFKGRNIKEVIPHDNISNVLLNLLKFKHTIQFNYEKKDELKNNIKYIVKVKPEVNAELEIAHVIFIIQKDLQNSTASPDIALNQSEIASSQVLPNIVSE